MKKLLLLFVLLPLLNYAHQDTYHLEEYGNVTVRFKTGHYYEEIQNAKIIGEYAYMLCEKLGYDKQVVLDFIHDYGHTYYGNTFSYISYGRESFTYESYYREDTSSNLHGRTLYPVPYREVIKFDKGEIIKESYESPMTNKKDKIVIRQFGFHFEIKETLDLLHYAVSNINALKKNSDVDTLVSYLNNMYYLIPTIPQSEIYSAIHTGSKDVQDVLARKVYSETDTIKHSTVYYSYFAADNKYHLFYGLHGKEIVMDTLNQIYSFYETEYFPQRLFVFEKSNRMRCYVEKSLFDEYSFKRSTIHDLPIDVFEYTVSIDAKWIGDDIYMINYNNSFMWDPFKRFIYLDEEDVLIVDFDDYIENKRDKK